MMRQLLILILILSVVAPSAFVQSGAIGVHPEYNIGRQKITRKGILILEKELEYIQRDRGSSIIWETALAYGLTRFMGVRLFIPLFLKRKIDENVSRGISDISLEAIFIKFLKPFNVVAGTIGVLAPTGSITTVPRLGTGAYNIILTGEWLHSSPDWYTAFLLRPLISIKRKGRKPGSLLNFQYLFGPKFKLHNSKIPLALILELDGVYRKPTKINGHIDPNSGGTQIVFGPLLSFKKKNKIIQARFLLPIAQNLKGQQPKLDFIAGLNMQFYF